MIDRTKNNVIGTMRHSVACPFIQTDGQKACDCRPVDEAKAMRPLDVLRTFEPLPPEEIDALRRYSSLTSQAREKSMNLVDRLRNARPWFGKLVADAADEIERLQTRVSELEETLANIDIDAISGTADDQGSFAKFP